MRHNKSGLCFAEGKGAADEDLQRAVWNGDCLEVSAALGGGADPRSRGVGGHPLLKVAIYRGHLRLTQLLLDSGADPGAWQEDVSALEAAIGSGHTRIAYALLRFGVEPTWQDADMAARCGRTQLLRTLLKRGVEVNHFEGYGGTAAVTMVMSAAFAGETGAIQALVEYGADVNLSNENGWTALLSAASCGHTEVVRLLLSLGANAEAADKGGDTPRTMAAKEGHDEVARLLKEAGAIR